jgi:hypothetical protein
MSTLVTFGEAMVRLAPPGTAGSSRQRASR